MVRRASATSWGLIFAGDMCNSQNYRGTNREGRSRELLLGLYKCSVVLISIIAVVVMEIVVVVEEAVAVVVVVKAVVVVAAVVVVSTCFYRFES